MLPWLKKGPQQPAAELETQEISCFFCYNRCVPDLKNCVFSIEINWLAAVANATLFSSF